MNTRLKIGLAGAVRPNMPGVATELMAKVTGLSARHDFDVST